MTEPIPVPELPPKVHRRLVLRSRSTEPGVLLPFSLQLVPIVYPTPAGIESAPFDYRQFPTHPLTFWCGYELTTQFCTKFLCYNNSMVWQCAWIDCCYVFLTWMIWMDALTLRAPRALYCFTLKNPIRWNTSLFYFVIVHSFVSFLFALLRTILIPT